MPGLEHQHVFDHAEIGIPVRCSVHPWMEATIHVFDHPYFSVTDEDFGIDLGPLPPGRYTVSARHEILGTLTQEVTVGSNETAEIAFVFGSEKYLDVPRRESRAVSTATGSVDHRANRAARAAAPWAIARRACQHRTADRP